MTDPGDVSTATDAESPAPAAGGAFGWVEVLAIAILPVLAIVSIVVLAAKRDPAGEPSSKECWSQTVAQSEVGTLSVQLSDAAGDCLTGEPQMSELAPDGQGFSMTLTYTNIAPESQAGVLVRVALPPEFEPGPGPVMVAIVSTEPVPGYQASNEIWGSGLDLGTLQRGASATIDVAVRVVGPAPEPRDDESTSQLRVNAGPASDDDPVSDVLLIEWDEVSD